MAYAIMLGSNMFVGTTGILTVEQDGKAKEFFRVRDIDKARSTGGYIVIDCDIRDSSGEREIKLFKNRPVASGDDISVDYTPKSTAVTRADGSVVIRVEEVPADDPTLPISGPVAQALDSVGSILRITGDFYAGPYKLHISDDIMQVGGTTLSGNLSVGTGGMRLGQMGFAM